MAKVYSTFLDETAQGNIIWKATGGATIKAQLTNSSYTQNQETHTVRSSITADKTSGTTDQTLTLTDPATDTTNDRVELDAADITFSSVTSGNTVESVILYKEVSGVGSDILIAWLDFSAGTIASNGGDITVAFNAEGCVALGYA
jgi:hypothetical protein